MTQRNLRVGIVGLGFGAAVHAPALQRLDNVNLVGIAGRNAERTREAAHKLGIAHSCISIDELLDLQVDAVTLALPPDQVFQAARSALNRNVAVLCEKPLGLNANEASELVKMAHGKITAMDFIFAELDTFRRLKKIIDTKQLGTVRHANVLWLTESWAQRSKNWSWKTDAAQGGGVSTLFGTHLYFLAEWLFGPAQSVIACANSSVSAAFSPAGEQAAEELVHCISKHNSDVTWAATFGNANPGLAVHRWTIVFERGHAILENIGNDYTGGFTLTVTCQDEISQWHEAAAENDGRVFAFKRLAQRFVNGVRENQIVYPNFEAGARAQKFDQVVRNASHSFTGTPLV